MSIRPLRLVMALTLSFAALGSAHAGPIIDQSYVAVTGQGYNTSVSSNLPIGQEFTPTLGGLDFVDLYIGDAQVGAGSGADFLVRVRSGGIAGAILGTSGIASVANDTNLGVGLYANFTVTRFTFAGQVSLTPGSTYVLEIVQQTPVPSGSGNFIVYGGPLGTSDYGGGRAIVGGVAQGGFDLNFSEGIFATAAAVPEPSTVGSMGIAGLIGLFARRRRRLLVLG